MHKRNLVTSDLQKHCHKPCVLNVQYLHTSHVTLHTVEAVYYHSKPRSCSVLRTVEVGPIFSGPSAGNRPCLEQSQGSNTRAKAAAKAATLSAASSRLPGRGENQALHSTALLFAIFVNRKKRNNGAQFGVALPECQHLHHLLRHQTAARRQRQLPQMKSSAQPILLMPNPPILLLVLQYLSVLTAPST